MENITIVPVMEHFEAYENGQFVCSGDTFDEIMRDLIEEGKL